MIRHLTMADFKVMPWANGRGQTTEMWRQDRDGALLWRLSRAAVVEDGPFSLFAGVDRNLTVISGPGFDLVGEGRLAARPLQPVAFAGDVPIRAVGVTAPSEDFNVMVRRGVVQATVAVRPAGVTHGQVALFAVQGLQVGAFKVQPNDLILADEPLEFQGQAIVVGLTGVPQGFAA